MKNKTIILGGHYDFLCFMYHNVISGKLFVSYRHSSNDKQYNEHLKDLRYDKEDIKEKNIGLFNDWFGTQHTGYSTMLNELIDKISTYKQKGDLFPLFAPVIMISPTKRATDWLADFVCDYAENKEFRQKETTLGFIPFKTDHQFSKTHMARLVHFLSPILDKLVQNQRFMAVYGDSILSVFTHSSIIEGMYNICRDDKTISKEEAFDMLFANLFTHITKDYYVPDEVTLFATKTNCNNMFVTAMERFFEQYLQFSNQKGFSEHPNVVKLVHDVIRNLQSTWCNKKVPDKYETQFNYVLDLLEGFTHRSDVLSNSTSGKQRKKLKV